MRRIRMHFNRVKITDTHKNYVHAETVLAGSRGGVAMIFFSSGVTGMALGFRRRELTFDKPAPPKKKNNQT